MNSLFFGSFLAAMATGLPIAIFWSRGAKSGKVRKNGLMRVEHDGAYLMVGSQGGAPTDPAWVANVRKYPDQVTVHFPWGSLLRGLLAADPAVLTGLARLLRPGGTLSVLVSSTARDRAAGVEPIDRHTLGALAGAYDRHGLAVTRVRPATPADVAASRSTWGKRLGAGTRRPAWLLEATRVPAAVS